MKEQKKEKDQIQVINRARLFFSDDQVTHKAEELGFKIIQVVDEDQPNEVTAVIPEWDAQIEKDLKADLKKEEDDLQAEIKEHFQKHQIQKIPEVQTAYDDESQENPIEYGLDRSMFYSEHFNAEEDLK